jgi:hypothetical protein
LGEHGLEADTAKNRREFSRRMEGICAEDLAGEYQPLRRGWKLGGEDFRDWLADKLARGGREGERASERREIDHVLAERLTQSCLREVGWDSGDLKSARKGDAIKIEIARQLRTCTPMTRRWIAQRLHMGSVGYLSNLLADDDIKL